ncbi:MAG: hypothetical protein KJ000_34380 [Pirellulaceae bacterium]|nr:hypothetical protein [Pirellulaceae bacterium]
MADENIEIQEKPAELRSSRFVIAILVCGAELIAYAVLSAAMGWENLGGLLFVFLLFAVVSTTWVAITGETFQRTLDMKSFRKFGQGPLYDQGFAAGRAGQKWEELDSELRQQDKYFEGYQDGLCNRPLEDIRVAPKGKRPE